MPRWLPGVLARIHALASLGKVHLTGKALEELQALKLGLDEHDVADVLRALTPAGCAGRVRSHGSEEWLYVFKPSIASLELYVKVALRSRCIVVSFHGEGAGDDED